MGWMVLSKDLAYAGLRGSVDMVLIAFGGGGGGGGVK